MKKILITLCLVLFSSSAFAGSCPMMAKKIDGKIEEVQKLRDQGKAAHKDATSRKDLYLGPPDYEEFEVII